MTGSETTDDLAALRESWPGWRFSRVWTSAASGPDRRRLTATRERDGVLLSAWGVPELAEKLRLES